MPLIDLEKIRSRLSVGRFFKDQPVAIKGHPLGYVSITDCDKMNPPEGSVQECLNMDFEPQGDRRRDPYSLLHDLSAVLPSGYSIKSFFEKVFIDAGGTAKTAIIVVALKALSPAKIYISKYYNPSSDYGNNHAVSAGWEEASWVELTEIFSDTVDAVNVDDGTYYEIESNGAGINTNADYYKGWFVYNNTNPGTSLGFVTDYSYSGGIGTFTIFRNPGTSISVSDDIRISRFPVNIKNQGNWENIEDADFEDTFNSVRIALGHESRPVLINFLSEKKFFGALAGIGDFNPDWNGFWMSFDAPVITNKDVLFVREAHTEGIVSHYVDDELQDLGIRLRIDPSKTDDTSTHNYDELWSVCIKLDGFQTFFVRSLIGKWFYDGFVNRRTALTLWLEYQADFDRRISHSQIFYERSEAGKHIDTGKETTLPDPKQLSEARGGELSVNEDAVTGISIPVPISVFGIDNLHSRGGYTDTAYPAVWRVKINSAGSPDTFVWNRDGGGFSAPINIANQPQLLEFGVSIFFETTTGHTVNDEWEIRTTTTITKKLQTYDLGAYNPVQENGFEAKPENNGSTLHNYLNQLYDKDIHIKPKQFIQVDENIVALNLSPDNISEDTKTEKKQGVSKGAFSQLQDGNINAYSIFSSERIESLAREEITGGISTVGLNFLVFTERDCIWYEIADEDNFLLRTVGTFANQGAYSLRGITSAVTEEKAPMGTASQEVGARQFGGVYWISPKGIFMFRDNEPVNILKGRWLNQYMTISNSNKQNAKAGYLPGKKEVFFVIGNDIWVWSLLYEHWKIYSFTSVPVHFVSARNGELLFAGTNKIFTTNPPETTEHLDEGSIGFDFYLAQYVSGGTAVKNKIIHSIDLIYNMITTVVLGEFTDGKVKVEVTGNESSTGNLHSRDWLLSGKFKKGLMLRNNAAGEYSRKRVNYAKIKISSENTTKANIRKFLIREILVMLKIGGSKGTRI